MSTSIPAAAAESEVQAGNEEAQTGEQAGDVDGEACASVKPASGRSRKGKKHQKGKRRTQAQAQAATSAPAAAPSQPAAASTSSTSLRSITMWRPCVAPNALLALTLGIMAGRLEKTVEKEQRTFSLPPAFAAEPGGPPELYPFPPVWLGDPRGAMAELKLPEGFYHLGEAAAQKFLEQQFMDLRWDDLVSAYEQARGGPEAPRPMQEHQSLFAAAGIELKVSGSGSASADFEQVMRRSAFDAQRGHLPRLREQRPCGHCRAPASNVCSCLEAYCGRECQRADWRTHRPTCERIRQAHALAVILTKMCWATGAGMR
eukprot:tig00000269_g23729.t1